MFDREAIARPLGHCRVVRRSKQSRQARGAPGRSSVHTFSARAPSRRAVSPASPAPLHGRRETKGETRLTFFRGAGNLPIHLCYD